MANMMSGGGSPLSAVTGMFGGMMKGEQLLRGEQGGRRRLQEQYGRAIGEYDPYSELGREQAEGLRNWLASPEGAFAQPTMEQIQATPGYETRLGAIESSAAARGGLLSGNALRDIGEFGASEYDREMARRQNELRNRLSIATGVGMPAARGMSGLYTDLGQELAASRRRRGEIEGQRTDEVMGSLGSLGGMG